MLSQTAEYALRAMSSLAYFPGELVPTPTLAKQTRVPANYLAKVLQLLAGAGLIIGRRGVGGGYRLARPASEITMLHIVDAVDSVKRIETCPLGLPNHGANLCPLHKKVDDAVRAVQEVFGSTTLLDLTSDPAASKPLCDAEMFAELTMGADAASATNGQSQGPGQGPGQA